MKYWFFCLFWVFVWKSVGRYFLFWEMNYFYEVFCGWLGFVYVVVCI